MSIRLRLSALVWARLAPLAVAGLACAALAALPSPGWSEQEPRADEREDCGVIGAAAETCPAAAASDLPPTLPFALHFQDEVSPYRLVTTSVLPGETLAIEAVFTDPGMRFTGVADGGELERLGPEHWRWHAPDRPGRHCIEITESFAGRTACLQVFVLVPWDGASERLNGYRIGSYPERPLRENPSFSRPRGFIEVTPENADLYVSPNFRLRQFVAKQQADWPRYLVLHTRLLLKLEMLLERIRAEGIEAPTLHVMSGYRTPHYNTSIGNRTRYSRHTYGDAADVFVDADADGRMDDLDGDGRSTLTDARILYDLIDSMQGETWYAPFIGGLSLYGPKPQRGPFVHIDSRGYRARW